jgi:hypothetical protein
MNKTGRGSLKYQPGEELINGRLSIYLGKSRAGRYVRLDIMVIGDFLMGPLSLSLHKESTYDHVSHTVVWLGKHDDQGQGEVDKVVEFPIEHIMEYLHLMGLN